MATTRKDTPQSMPPPPSPHATDPDCEVPEWMGCDLSVCRMFQDVSSQIAATCRTLGTQLQGACGQATGQLPALRPGGKAPHDCADQCFTFLKAFDALSEALLLLAGDLENGVTQPLQKTILTLQEESVGRTKHWQQVRRRFAELQDRYCRSQKKSLEARKSLASTGDAGSWFGSKNKPGSSSIKAAASEQHAAMCELAQCEEELRRSEASLRQFEDESRERLTQLNNEKWQRMGEALTRGAGSLKRLLPVIAGKELPADDAEWKGVVPPSSSQPADALAGEGRASPLSDVGAGRVALAPQVSPPQSACGAAGGSLDGAATRARPADVLKDVQEPGLADPSLKYLKGSGAASGEDSLALEIGGLSDEAEPEMDAAARAAVWSPPAKSSPMGQGGGIRKPRSLVFANSGGSLVAGSSVRPVVRRAQTTPTLAGSLLHDQSQDDAGKDHIASVAPLTLSKLAEFQSGIVGGATSARRWSADAASSSSFSAAAPLATEEDAAAAEWASVPEAGPGRKAQAATSPQHHPRSSVAEVVTAEEPDSESSSEEEDEVASASSPQSRLQPLQVELEVSPLVAVAEELQRFFERYTERVDERLSCATETRWDRLLARAGEQIAGGHVGKLECFWIHEVGVEASPEAATGLVCFQFVQGHASNYVRILHLSVVRDFTVREGVPASWCQLLPPALSEARRLIFSTLPADNLRAVVLTGEDDQGRMYFDRDVEAAYQKCGFRWFQLTQSIRRSRSAFRATKIKPSLRFLVFSTSRSQSDPPRPAGGLKPLSALLFKSDREATAEATAEASAAGEVLGNFSAW